MRFRVEKRLMGVIQGVMLVKAITSKIHSKYLVGHTPNEKLDQFLKEKKSFFRYVKINSDSIRKDLEKGLYSKYKHNLVGAEHMPSGSGKYVKINVEETNQ